MLRATVADDTHAHPLSLFGWQLWIACACKVQSLLGGAFKAFFAAMFRLEDDEGLVLTPFEKNLEVWRQLWRVLERSDIVVQVCYSTSVTLKGNTTTHTSRMDVIEHHGGLVSTEFDLFLCLWLGMSYAGQLLCNATLTMLHTLREKQHAGLLAPTVMQGVHSAVALIKTVTTTLTSALFETFVINAWKSAVVNVVVTIVHPCFHCVSSG